MSDPTDPGDPKGGSTPPETPGSVAARRRAPPVARIARVVIGCGLVALCVVVVWWWAIGGRWFIVRTPSMGTYAPVGTLVWVKPVDIHDLHVGDVITFHTPTTAVRGMVGNKVSLVRTPSAIYTHRIVAVDANGTVQTKGDLNGGRDPWLIDQHDLVGQVMATWPGVGWLVGALPLLVPAGIAWWVLTRLFASERSRAPLRVLGTASLLALAIYIYNPLFGAKELSFVPVSNAAAEATYVGTGIMPVQLKAQDSHPVTIHAGQERSIVTSQGAQGGRYRVQLEPTIPWETWLVIAVGCLAPAVWSVITGVELAPPRRRRTKEEPDAAPMGPELGTT